MRKIIVCDDDKTFMGRVVTILNKYATLYNAEVIGFAEANEAIEYCCNNKVNIIYMDIEIGSENGMSLAKKIRIINPNVLIIYISCHDSYYIELVQAEPFRFIRKDVNPEELERNIANTLEMAMKRINGADRIIYEFGKKQYSVELDWVKYFQSRGRTITINGFLNKTNQPYFYGKMDILQQELEKKNIGFIRINRSCIVNMEYADYMGKNRIQIDNKKFSITSKYTEHFSVRYGKFEEMSRKRM